MLPSACRVLPVSAQLPRQALHQGIVSNVMLASIQMECGDVKIVGLGLTPAHLVPSVACFVLMVPAHLNWGQLHQALALHVRLASLQAAKDARLVKLVCLRALLVLSSANFVPAASFLLVWVKQFVGVAVADAIQTF